MSALLWLGSPVVVLVLWYPYEKGQRPSRQMEPGLHSDITLVHSEEWEVYQISISIWGKQYTLAEVSALPYVLRMRDLQLTPLFSARVTDWFKRVQVRVAYETAVTNWGPAKLIQLLETYGRKLWPELEKLAAKIQA